MVAFPLELELETRRELNLPFAEEGSSSFIYRPKDWVEGQDRGRIWTGSLYRSGVDAGIETTHLGAVEDVEAFSQHFDVHALSYVESTRNSEVGVHDLGKLEVVSRDECESRRPV